jgi:hypothetical protein
MQEDNGSRNVKYLKQQESFLLLEILFHFNVLMYNLD